MQSERRVGMFKYLSPFYKYLNIIGLKLGLIVTMRLLNNVTLKMIGQIIRFFNIYKNITIFNLQRWLVFDMVGVMIYPVTYFSTKITYTSLHI